MSFGTVFGAAMQGIGAGMMQQTQANQAAQAEQAKETAAMRREVALETMRNQNALARDKAQSDNRIGEMRAGAQFDDWKDARGTARKTTSSITIKQAEAKIDAKLEKAKSDLKINEDTKAWLRDIYQKAYMSNIEVGETKAATDGSLIVLSKSGKIIAQTKPGMFRPDGKPDDALGGGMLPGGSSIPNAPTALQKAPANRPPLTSFDR